MENWLDKEEYLFESKYLDIEDAKLHYFDEGTGPVLLFIHGTPSWSFDFRNIIKKIAINYRCVAIDHNGFGLSEKPKGYNYSTPGHSKNLEQLVDKLNLTNITLIVHDFGGPIGLNLGVDRP